MSVPWWTVSAVYKDTDEGFVSHVQARDAEAAKAATYRSADSVITIANVFEGKIKPVEEVAHDVTPLKGRGHAVEVARVSVETRQITVPSRCPKCRADLRKPHAIRQRDLVERAWTGHLGRGGEVAAERDHAPASRSRPLAAASRVQCAACDWHAWDGVHVEKAG